MSIPRVADYVDQWKATRAEARAIFVFKLIPSRRSVARRIWAVVDISITSSN